MIMSPDNLSTTVCVANNRNLFEDVAKKHVDSKDIFKTQYIVLDYEMILNQMVEFIDGYKEYSKDDTQKYSGKVLTITRNFYDKMFTDKKYKKVINLEQFKDLNIAFLKKTNKMQALLRSYLDNKNLSAEMNSLIRMTDNQYKKLFKVYKDDMNIYLWLSTKDSPVLPYNVSSSIKEAFANKKTPVMHKYVKSDWE